MRNGTNTTKVNVQLNGRGGHTSQNTVQKLKLVEQSWLRIFGVMQGWYGQRIFQPTGSNNADTYKENSLNSLTPPFRFYCETTPDDILQKGIGDTTKVGVWNFL